MIANGRGDNMIPNRSKPNGNWGEQVEAGKAVAVESGQTGRWIPLCMSLSTQQCHTLDVC